MGLFAPIGPRLASRLGPRLAFAACIALISGFGAARSVAPNVPLILVATFGVGVGIGVAGAIPSMIVAGRSRCGRRSGRAPMRPGSSPLPRSQRPSPSRSPSTASGGCRCSRSLGSVLCIVVWLVLSRGPGGDAPATPVRVHAALAVTHTAWILVLVFGLQSMQFYGVSAWIPNVYIERGWTVAAAGALVAVFNGVGLLTTVGVPLVADRLGARRPQLVVAAVIGTLAFVGIALFPTRPTCGWRSWASPLARSSRSCLRCRSTSPTTPPGSDPSPP